MARDFTDIAARRKPRRHTVWVVLDHDLADQIAQLERDVRAAKLQDARENRTPQAPQLQAELERLEVEIHDAAEPFTFQALPRREYRELLESHPDPAGEKRWNTETFPPALIAASSVDPPMTLEQAETAYTEWDTTQAETLFWGAYQANEGESQVPFSVRNSEGTRVSEQN